MAPILKGKEKQKYLRDIAERTYGKDQIRHHAVQFPMRSTMPGTRPTFMPAPDGRPAGFSEDGMTYTTPAVTAEVPKPVGSPEWSAEYGDFLWSQHDFKKSRGEDVPPVGDYIREGIIEKVLAHRQGYQVPTKRKK